VTHVAPADMVAGLADRLDPDMYRILNGAEDP
jgi:hypothetical protein